MATKILGLRLRKDQISRLNNLGCYIYIHRENRRAVFANVSDLIFDVRLPSNAVDIEEMPKGGWAVIPEPFPRLLTWTPMKEGNYGRMTGLRMLWHEDMI